MAEFGFTVSFGDRTYQEASYLVIRVGTRMCLPEDDRLHYTDAEERTGLVWDVNVEGSSRAAALEDLQDNLPDGCTIQDREEVS